MKRLYSIILFCFIWIGVSQAGSKHVFYPASSDRSLQHGILFQSDKTKPKAALLFVHGMQSHAEWLRASGVGQALADSGLLVFAYDRRGSGQSTSQRGHADSARQLLEDMNDAIRVFRSEMPRALEMHVMANCFGARILIPYLSTAESQNKVPFATVTLIAPSTHMRARAEYSLSDRLAVMLSSDGEYFSTPLQDEWFVSAGPGLEWIQNDDKGLREVTAGFLKVTRKLSKIMEKNVYTMKTPLLIFTAKNDFMVDSDAVRQELFTPYSGPKRLIEVDSEHSLEFSAGGKGPLVKGTVDWILGSGRKTWYK